MCGFQRRDGLLARDGWEVIEELVEAVAAFEVIDQVSQRHPCSNEYGRTPQDFWVAVDNPRVLHHRDPPGPLYTASRGVVKDDAEGGAIAGMEPADAVPHRHAIEAAGAGDRAVIDREDHCIALL